MTKRYLVCLKKKRLWIFLTRRIGKRGVIALGSLRNRLARKSWLCRWKRDQSGSY